MEGWTVIQMIDGGWIRILGMVTGFRLDVLCKATRLKNQTNAQADEQMKRELRKDEAGRLTGASARLALPISIVAVMIIIIYFYYF